MQVDCLELELDPGLGYWVLTFRCMWEGLSKDCFPSALCCLLTT